MKVNRKILDLESSVPPNAEEVKFHYSIKPALQKVVVFRSETDQFPLTLHGPNGNAVMKLLTPQKLFIDVQEGVSVNIGVTGYSLPN